MSNNHTRTHQAVARTAAMSTATSVAVLMFTIPAPTYAEPGCSQYTAEDGRFELRENNGTWVHFPASGTAFGGSGNASIFFTDGDILQARYAGRIEGRTVTFTVEAGDPGKYTKSYTGTVGDDGIARGTVHTVADLSPAIPDGPLTLDDDWEARTPLKCDAAAPPPAQPAPQQKPPPPPPPPPPPEIRLRYETQTFPVQSITAFVRITNNENKPEVDCTYSDGVNPERPFSVTGSAESRIDIIAPPTNTLFHITVACDNGLVHKQDKTY